MNYTRYIRMVWSDYANSDSCPGSDSVDSVGVLHYRYVSLRLEAKV